jgi:hypothetical protein
MRARAQLIFLAPVILAALAATARPGEEAVPPKAGEPAPGAARRDSEFQAAVTWDADLATVTWKETLTDRSGGFSVILGPYLGWLSDTEVVVGWEVAAESKPASVSGGGYPMDRIKLRWARLEGLKPDSPYRCKLVSGGYASAEMTFRTLPAPGSAKLRFAVIGDTQNATVGAATVEKLYASIRAWRPPLVLHLGDMVYGTGSGYDLRQRRNWQGSLRIAQPVRASTLLAPVVGNHDIKPGLYPWPADYYGDIPAGKANAAGEARPPYYYSFDAANVHLVALCTEARKGGTGEPPGEKLFGAFTYAEQLAWLEADLAGAKADWTIAFFHQPLHTVGGPAAAPELREDLGRILDKHKVPLILSGHCHNYQRTWRITNADRQRSEAGTVQVVSGGANGFHKCKDAEWNRRHDEVYHYLRVEVDGESMIFEAVDADGKVFDRWRLKKNGQPEDLPLPAKAGG